MWNKILKFFNDNKDALGLLFGSGVVLAVLGGIYRLVVWLIKEYRLRRIRTNDNFPFKIIPPNSNVAKEILGGPDNDPLADRNIPYQQRIQGRNTRRELEELIDDNRCILIIGRTGLGKTREAVQLAQSLNNEGWTVLCLTREAWLDAPAILPNSIPERKLVFFLDDLNKKCFSSKAEIRPDANESLTLPIYEPFQMRLQRTLETFETFCGKSEIRIIATARNEKEAELDEPSEWDKLAWTKYKDLWEKFKITELSEPDKTAEEKLLAETAAKADIFIKSDKLLTLANKNDGTFRNLVENLSYARTEGFILSPDSFRDTLKGTWEKRYQRAIQKYPDSKHIYDAIELLQIIGLEPRFSTVLQVTRIISNERPFRRIKSRWKYSSILKQLSKMENILRPRDGQIEAKKNRVNVQKYLPNLHQAIFQEYRRIEWTSSFDKIAYTLDVLAFPRWLLPKIIKKEKLSWVEKIFIILNNPNVLNLYALSYERFGYTYEALELYKTCIDLYKYSPMRLFWGPKYWKGAYLYQNYGNAYREKRQYDRAIQAYEKAIELDPKAAPSWRGLGNTYREMEQYDKSIQAYKKAIELDPKAQYSWNGLGYVYGILRRWDDAIRAFEQAIELDPNLASPWYGLGLVYCDMKNFDKAFLVQKKAVEISPKEITFRFSLLSTLRRLGLVAEAKENENIIRLFLDNENEYNRACFESICGNTDEALRLLNLALQQKQTDLEWVRQDPDFDFIRDDPRFQELVGINSNSP